MYAGPKTLNKKDAHNSSFAVTNQPDWKSGASGRMLVGLKFPSVHRFQFSNSGAGIPIKVVGFKKDIWRLPNLDNGWLVSEVCPKGKFGPRRA